MNQQHYIDVLTKARDGLHLALEDMPQETPQQRRAVGRVYEVIHELEFARKAAVSSLSEV